jgi:diguanylate cyclase (GGDEF)-like protein
VAHRGGATPDVPALVLAALVLWVGDILTAPLVLAPLSGEAPGRIVGAVARETWLAEGAQYLLGLLGALAAARAPWAPALLVAPLVVGYGALAAAQAARAEAERAARESRHRSTHDALTGLPNRALLQDRLEQALRALARDGTRLALLLLDLDRFKWVNDTLGHATGDALLREVAARLGGAVRASDTVARLGGDEFAVLLPEADAEGAARVARALHRALDAPVVVDGQALRAEISVGGALAPLHGADPDALLRRADAAMYVAKRGRLGYVLYDPAQKRGDGARLRRAAALRAAIARGALELHYQPQVRARPGPAGLPGWRAEAEARAEALVRWPDGDGQGRLVSPGAFIPLAEETGLIVPLTRWVLGEATRQCRAWEGAGLRCAVAVNLSAWDLQDARCLDTVAGALAGAGLGPERLVLEVTESALLADIARGRETLARLRGMGVRVALDDFGTGYASLARLRELPVDELKVDQGFVRRVAADAADAAVVGAIVALGHALGLEVVAEGVEDQATWERLAALGCDTVQGYHVSRPLPADELARWLHAQPGAPYH